MLYEAQSGAEGTIWQVIPHAKALVPSSRGSCQMGVMEEH